MPFPESSAHYTKIIVGSHNKGRRKCFLSTTLNTNTYVACWRWSWWKEGWCCCWWSCSQAKGTSHLFPMHKLSAYFTSVDTFFFLGVMISPKEKVGVKATKVWADALIPHYFLYFYSFSLEGRGKSVLCVDRRRTKAREREINGQKKTKNRCIIFFSCLSPQLFCRREKKHIKNPPPEIFHPVGGYRMSSKSTINHFQYFYNNYIGLASHNLLLYTIPVWHFPPKRISPSKSRKTFDAPGSLKLLFFSWWGSFSMK